MKRLMTSRRWLMGAVAVAALSLVGLSPSAISAAESVTTFDLRYGDNCIGGTASPGATLSVDWRDGAGKKKAESQFTTGSGIWTLCAKAGKELTAGDTIRVSDAETSRDYTVPDLSVTADRVNDVFRGTGPANQDVLVSYLLSAQDPIVQEHTVRVGEDGQWSYVPQDLGNVMGGQKVSVSWTSPDNDSLRFDSSAPFVVLQLWTSRYSGAATPLTRVSLQLFKGSSLFAHTNTFAGSLRGLFHGNWRDANGGAVYVSPGDRFYAPSLAADADWIVPRITARADKSREIVSGRCYDPGDSAGQYVITITRSGNLRGVVTGSVDNAKGQFVADFAHPAPGLNRANIRSGDLVSVSCLQRTGDSVAFLFVVP